MRWTASAKRVKWSHVFLSYSRTDRALATAVTRDLSGLGLEVWTDRRLGLGGSWLVKISAAIADARAVVLLATPSALASRWVMREVEAAWALNKAVVPLLAGGSRFGDLPAGLAGVNGVDLADGYNASMALVAQAFSTPVDAIAPEVSTTVPVLMLLTADTVVADAVAGVAPPVGLAVVRVDLGSRDLFEVASSARMAVIDERVGGDSRFVAGYVAGRGGRVVWVSESCGSRAADLDTITVVLPEAAELERRICVAAFLPSRMPG